MSKVTGNPVNSVQFIYLFTPCLISKCLEAEFSTCFKDDGIHSNRNFCIKEVLSVATKFSGPLSCVVVNPNVIG